MESENWIDVFQSTTLNKNLRDDGIVKVTLPNFDPTPYRSLLSSKVDGYPEKFESSFYQSVSINDLEVKRAIHSGINEILTPVIDSLLINHRLLTYFFLVKGVGEKSLLNLHQDWSIVDERKCRAYSLWIPLSTSTKQNGTVYAAKGTHRLPLNIRGAGIPPKYGHNVELVKKFMEPFEVKLGEALIFDTRLLHYSPSNTSNASRTTIINNIIPIGAETICFHGSMIDEQFTVNRYNVPEDLFIHYDNFILQKDKPHPKGIFVETTDYANVHELELAEFRALVKLTSTKKKRWFF